MEIYWTEQAQLYITPVADCEICVALISRYSRLRLHQALDLFPEVQARLRGSSANDGERGGATSTRTLQAVTRGRVALVGDASGGVDAITGEGLCLAMKQSAALADAMAADDLARYQTAHEKLMWRARAMSRLMLTLDGRPRLQEWAVRAMGAWPQSFATLLAFHVGAFPSGASA